MPGLTLDIRTDGAFQVVIAVSGEVDMATAPELAAYLRDHADRDVLVDLSNVGFLDSSGIGALLEGYNALADAGRVLRTTGERDNVRRVIEIAGVAGLLHGDDDT
jgi:anti-sigma B factor antagonist